jgi:PAS domain-containing protein
VPTAQAPGKTRAPHGRAKSDKHDDWAHEFWRSALDSMPAHTAVLDDGGEIIAVNEAWRRFARENGSGTDFVGVNYLEICAA